MFDIAFDEDPSKALAPEIPEGIPEIEEEPEEIIPTFSEEEVEEARQQGFEAGKQEGLAATTEVLTKQINDSLTQINQKLTAAFQKQDSVNEELPRAALSVALGICQKMLPSMAERHSFDEVERVLNDVFEKIVEEPSVKITVHTSLVDEVKERIDDLSASKGFEGRTLLQADEATAAGDCKIEWANGGSEKNSTALWQEINGIIQRNLGNTPTIWDEPEGMEYLPAADLTAPEALVEPVEEVPTAENTAATDVAEAVEETDEHQATASESEESLQGEVQQPNSDD